MDTTALDLVGHRQYPWTEHVDQVRWYYLKHIVLFDHGVVGIGSGTVNLDEVPLGMAFPKVLQFDIMRDSNNLVLITPLHSVISTTDPPHTITCADHIIALLR